MKWHIFAVGKPKLFYAQHGLEEYRKRLSCDLEFHYIKSSDSENESKQMLQKTEKMFRILLDEKGKQIASKQFAEKISHWEQESVKNIAFIIGGADGHSPALKKSCHWTWSLSKLTLQHELALLLLLEQLYRAYSIKNGLPYHRE